MKWYGSLNNRLEENREFCEVIEVGTGMTEYLWSDRHAYEVIEVKSQKNVVVRELGHRAKSEGWHNDWELYSDPNLPTLEMVKRGKYWYSVVECTPEDAQRAKDAYANGKYDLLLWMAHNDFNADEILATGKAKKKYHRKNVSFGIADYYYDFEF
ncbi:MAG: hypothetical protein IKU35_06565 [Bacteroidaceae bacterium]|nr:hypothetical protein [Bacteroidaceae bacterium]